MENYLSILYTEAQKAFKKKEVPVSAIVELNGKVIAKAYNKREKNNSVLEHAEVRAIIKASKKLKTWKLDNCNVYVTLKPCSMCSEILKSARVKNVYYLLEKPVSKKEYSKTKFIQTNVCMNFTKSYQKMLNKFFAQMRK